MTTSGLSLNHAVCACGTLRGVAPLSLSLALSFLLVSDLPSGAISSTLAHSSHLRLLAHSLHIHTRVRCVPALLLSRFALDFINAAPFHARFSPPRLPAYSSVASLPLPCEFASRFAEEGYFCSWWRFGVLWTCWSLLLVSISVALR